MPFPYTHVCDLLQQLEDELCKPKTKQRPSRTIISQWFDGHRALLHTPGNDASAILSTLLPERRTDRVYFLQAPRLQSIIGQAFGLGVSRVKELRRYQIPGLGVDLGDCVEGILKQTPNPDCGFGTLTVEEIDSVLGGIASACRFSSPAVQASRNKEGLRHANTNQALINIYNRLSARDAKWFTRLVLKSYEPIFLDHSTVFRSYHRLLPQLLKVCDDFTVATPFLHYINESPGDQVRVANMLKPRLGTKVGRQSWFKARSIHHCLEMGRGRTISCEQKLDGEYCQIHIDRSRGSQCIQIFSKSGKDSTRDRERLHSAIRESLKLGKPDCPVEKGCILEGELVVYSTQDHKILPFHKIRKHVSRSGCFIGTKFDSQRHYHEHLMIVYYDVLMIDDESLLGLRHSERMKRLTNLITCRTGYAEIVPRQVISLSRRAGGMQLREAFAQCIVRRSEGLVLKPDEPYFDFTANFQPYNSCNIKLKKEYVQGWGDVGDFAVVGASYDPVKAKTYGIQNLKWTHFFIGCLDDRHQPATGLQRPRFLVANVVELNATMLQTVVTHCSSASVPFEEDERFELDFRGLGSTKTPGVVFLEPMVFDVRCFSFEKAPNTNFLTMRFPMVSKVHFDRSWTDTITFSELQEAAVTATETPEYDDSQEMRSWIKALEKADPRRVIDNFSSQQSSISEAISSPDAFCDKATIRGEAIELRGEGYGSRLASLAGEVSPTPLTPPRSSTMVSSRRESSSRKRRDTISVHRGSTKRARELGACTPSPRKRRRQSYESGVGPSPLKTAFESSRSPIRTRQPLGSIDSNTLPTEQISSPNKIPERPASSHVSETLPSDPPVCPSSSPARSFHTARAAPSSPPAKPPQHNEEEEEENDDNDDDDAPQEKTPTAPAPRRPHTCSLAGPACAFANYSLLLSPCIAAYPWVTHDLLGRHGISEFSVDPSAWHHKHHHHRRSTPPAASSSARPPRAPKICLVESRREEATAEFVRQIERAGPRRRNGDREWVAVYDWRVLESVAEREEGRGTGAGTGRGGEKTGMDPFRRWYVGIA